MRGLGTGPARSIGWWAGGFLAIAVFLRFIEPGGTPLAIVFQGLVFGIVSSLVTVGIVLIYRSSRVINFAQAAIGAVGGAFAYNLVVAETTSFPFLAALPIGLLVAGATGAALEAAFVRRFFNAPRLVLTVVTIALLPAIGFAAGFVTNLPLFGDPLEREQAERLGIATVKLPFEGLKFQVGDFGLQFGFPHLLALALSIIALLGIAAFLRYTRLGIAVRASAENADRAMLLGINVGGLSTIIWTLAGILSGVGVIMTGVLGSFSSLSGANPNPISAGLVISLSAAVVARMRNLPTAVLATVGLQMMLRGVDFANREWIGLFNVFLFAVILVGLLFQRQPSGRSEEREVSSWEASQEFRATPLEILKVPGVRFWRGVLVFGGLVVLGLFPWFMSTGPTNVAGIIIISGIGILSLVILTGWTGQVSLGQFALIGVGALIGGGLTSRFGVSFWLALPLVAVTMGALSVLVGLPALRIRGLYLAVTTLAFALAVQSVMFDEKYFGWLLPTQVERPTLFFIDFEDERSMYYLAVVAFVLAAAVVALLRRSRSGRILIGLRDNEANVQAFGVNLIRTRLSAFAFSGALCGFAGVLIAHHQRAVEDSTFAAQVSLDLFIFAVIGGVGGVAGGVLGTVYYSLNRLFADNQLLGLVIGPIGLLVLLYAAPGGLTAILYGVRDSVYRIIAQRRRMIVPSLFADVDPAALESQLAPLAEPLENAGLATLPRDQRYRSRSGLYAGRGKGYGKARSPDTQKALASAAERLEES